MDSKLLTEEERNTLRELKEHLIQEAEANGMKKGAIRTLEEYKKFVC